MTTKYWDQHSEMVTALRKSGQEILDNLRPESVDIWHAATGICTEAGELLDAAKKLTIYNKPIDRENVIEELGDLEFYMEQIRQALSISRDDTIEANITKLSKRYGPKYSDQSAIARKDKE